MKPNHGFTIIGVLIIGTIVVSVFAAWFFTRPPNQEPENLSTSSTVAIPNITQDPNEFFDPELSVPEDFITQGPEPTSKLVVPTNTSIPTTKPTETPASTKSPVSTTIPDPTNPPTATPTSPTDTPIPTATVTPEPTSKPTPEPTPEPTQKESREKFFVGSTSTADMSDIISSLPLVFSDAAGDYTTPPGGAPPTGVYAYPPTDTLNVYMGIRNGQLYIKWDVAGTIPNDYEESHGQTIQAMAYNILLDVDNNEMTGWIGGETHIGVGLGFNIDANNYYVTSRANYIDDTGHEGNFEKTSEGILYTAHGGAGTSSIVASFALSDLLNTVQAGTTIRLSIWSEATSDLWHHFSVDQNDGWVTWNVSEI